MLAINRLSDVTLPGKPLPLAPSRSHTATDVLSARGAVKRTFARNAFERVSGAGLGKASPKDVMRVAKALWYEGFTPQYPLSCGYPAPAGAALQTRSLAAGQP